MASTAEVLEQMKKDPYETVFIIGTGIVENGWPAFKEAIFRAFGSNAHEGAPIHPIAAFTFQLRALALSKRKNTDFYRDRLNLIDIIAQQDSRDIH